jgi:hypothetical protein
MRIKTQRQLINSKAQIKTGAQTMLQEPRRKAPPKSLFWTIMRLAAPFFIIVGCLGALLGVLAGQSFGIVLADLMTATVGGVLLLLVRWRF